MLLTRLFSVFAGFVQPNDLTPLEFHDISGEGVKVSHPALAGPLDLVSGPVALGSPPIPDPFPCHRQGLFSNLILPQ